MRLLEYNWKFLLHLYYVLGYNFTYQLHDTLNIASVSIGQMEDPEDTTNASRGIHS